MKEIFNNDNHGEKCHEKQGVLSLEQGSKSE